MIINHLFNNLKHNFHGVFLSSKTSGACNRKFYLSSVHLKYFRSPIKYTKQSGNESFEESDETCFGEENPSFVDENLEKLVDRTVLLPNSGHQVFVIQPYIKWGQKKKINTTPELQLLESVTLIKTLRLWKVVGEMTIGLESFAKKTFFGKGNLESVKDLVNKCSKISAIFISVNTLSLIQQIKLEEYFGIHVFDRYTIIMHIFREHATSREAKLQVKLAELPYLWTVMKGMSLGIGEKFSGGASDLGGYVPRLLDYRKELFRSKVAKIKKSLMEVREQRGVFRKARKKKEIPTVAVLGYTNAGKTSIVKALTGKDNLEPKDYLFATLDVTCHLGKLPCNLDVGYLDTLGFISDIPTYLIESFVSTLEDATSADVIIHVRDISHPDTEAQNENVMKTLMDLNIPEDSFNNIITVGNKIDKVDQQYLIKYKNQNIILVSCTKLIGIDILRLEIEKRILAVADKIRVTIRVLSGSEEYDWLHSNSVIVEEVPDLNNLQYILLKVIVSSSTLAKFRYLYIKNFKNR